MNFKLWIENNFDDFKQKFIEIANLQRMIPEGDLIHRANEEITWKTAGYEYVKDKVEKILKLLNNEYGFEKEFQENIKNNAEYLKIDENQFRDKIYKALEEYSEAHVKLPAYNECQRTMKRICYCIGKRKWILAGHNLHKLEDHLNSPEEWIRFARQTN
jgi:hypothetical protein